MERARQFDIQLTDRQREVWRLVAKGHTNGEIAENLGITLDGAKWHVGELLTKLGATTREDLVEAWGVRHGVASRVREGLAPLFGFVPWTKAGIAAAAVGAVSGAVGLYGALGSSGSPPPPAAPVPPASISLPPQPPDASLAVDDAYAAAKFAAAQRMAEQLPQFLAVPSTTIEDLRLSGAQWLDRNGAFEIPETGYRWDAKPFPTHGAWAFSWVGEGLGEVGGPMGGHGNIRVDILLADWQTLEVLAWRAHVDVGDRSMHFGGSDGFGRSALQGTSDTFFVGWRNGEPDTGILALFESDMGVCYIYSNPPAGGGSSCSNQDRFVTQGIELLGGVTVVNMGQAVGSVAIVFTGDDVSSVLVRDQVGALGGPYPTAESPRELLPAGRAALISVPAFDEDYEVVGLDYAGREIAVWRSMGDRFSPGYPPR